MCRYNEITPNYAIDSYDIPLYLTQCPIFIVEEYLTWGRFGRDFQNDEFVSDVAAITRLIASSL